MLTMIEVVGVSAAGFTEAVQEAVGRLAAEGKRMHFLQVIEQRAALRDGTVREYQVVVKIAVDRE